jgi:molybdopterin synthase catalytic subunit
MKTLIVEEAFDAYALLAAHESELGDKKREIGAAAFFVGSMRDFNEGETVTGMTLDYYPGMTDRYLKELAETSQARWTLTDALIVHRVGQIAPTETIVLVGAWSAHRAHAFEACRHMMEELKSRAPFWKKEQTATGARWVERNTPGATSEFASGQPGHSAA